MLLISLSLLRIRAWFGWVLGKASLHAATGLHSHLEAGLGGGHMEDVSGCQQNSVLCLGRTEGLGVLLAGGCRPPSTSRCCPQWFPGGISQDAHLPASESLQLRPLIRHNRVPTDVLSSVPCSAGRSESCSRGGTFPREVGSQGCPPQGPLACVLTQKGI